MYGKKFKPMSILHGFCWDLNCTTLNKFLAYCHDQCYFKVLWKAETIFFQIFLKVSQIQHNFALQPPPKYTKT